MGVGSDAVVDVTAVDAGDNEKQCEGDQGVEAVKHKCDGVNLWFGLAVNQIFG